MKPRIAVDMDQVLVDLLTPWLERYNNDYQDNLKPSDIVSWNFCHIVKPECHKKIYTYLDDQSLFESLPIMDGSQEILKTLSNDYELFVVTAPWNPDNMATKFRYLQKNFSFISESNYVFTRNKSIVNADYLIDDKPDNFHEFRGKAILFEAPHNHAEVDFPRVKNWQDVGRFFEII